MYRLYFIYPLESGQFDPEGLKKYADWTYDIVKYKCLNYGVGIADLVDTQPVFPNSFKALIYFDFEDSWTCFDTFDENNFVRILDKMLEFTDTPPFVQGVFIEK